MSSTLTIEEVDLSLLEMQRVALASISPKARRHFKKRQIEALDGIQNMLDAWSDKRYFENFVNYSELK